MSHSYVKCWIHALWATKKRQPLIKETIEQSLYAEMKQELIKAGCFALIINGMPDHVHCLFSINPQKSISETIGHIKGTSSHWVNQRPLLADKFAWQTGFAAYSSANRNYKRYSIT
jgi:REP element-mobilizing transposase RayT